MALVITGKAILGGKAPPVENRDELFMSRFLLGEGCFQSAKRTIQWRSDDGRFVVAHHHSHPVFFTVFEKRKTCPSYYMLFDLNAFEISKELVPLGKWYGRWSKKVLQEVQDIIKRNQ
jgi:hypothetical protein